MKFAIYKNNKISAIFVEIRSATTVTVTEAAIEV